MHYKKLKSSILISSFLFIAFGLSSCEKQRYCAECYEYNSSYWASDYCGETEEVDEYIQELTTTGAAVGQAWSCDKVPE